MPREDIVIARVREISKLAYVEKVEDHFAGMWNELGFQIFVKPDTFDCEVIKLRNEVLASLSNMDTEDPLPFKWLVSFIRGTKTIDVLVSGDMPREPDETLYTL